MDKVFFIDDDPLVLRSFTRSLGKRDIPYDFYFYINCEEALSAMGTLDPLCIIADKNLPGMGGEDFLREVGERCPGTFRILISADSPSDKFLDVCDLYLEKPITSSALVSAIDELRERT